MPSSRKQFNFVVDDITEELIFQLVAIDHVSPTKLIKDLIATHPRIISQAQLAGLTPMPETIRHGRKPGKQVKE